jgi:HSP20 family protein
MAAEPRTDTQQSTGRTQQQTPVNRQLTSGRESTPMRRRSSFDASPFDLMRRVTEQMFGPSRAPELFAPSIEVFERDGKLHVTADLPGMSKDDVQIELRDNNLILRGERKEERKEDREGYFLTERTYGRFDRVIPLPDDVDPENARATFHDGVLELTMDLPRNHRSHSKSIPIEDRSERRP